MPILTGSLKMAGHMPSGPGFGIFQFYREAAGAGDEPARVMAASHG